MIGTDDCLLAVNLGGNAVCNHVVHLGVHLLMPDTALLCLADHGVCNGVRVVLLKASRNLQCFCLFHVIEGLNLHDSRRSAGQRSGLIKDDGICLRNGLHELAALHGYIAIARLTDCREHGERHGELQRTGEIDHQERECLCDISRQEEGQCRTAERVRNQTVRKMVGSRLGVGL